MPKKFLQNLFQDLQKTFLRFPLIFINNIILFFISVFLIFQNKYNNDFPLLSKMIFLGILNFPLLIAAQLLAENIDSKITKIKPLLMINILVVFFSVTYFFILPAKFEDFLFSDFTQIFLLFTGFLVAIFIAPFWNKKNCTNQIWNFGWQIIINFSLAFFFALTLFISAIACFAALDVLFDFTNTDEWIFSSFVFCSEIIASFIFLKKLPQKNEIKINQNNHQSLLYKFALFVLLPFLIFYGGILIVYFLKILFTSSWPEGFLANLILVFLFTLFLANFIFFAIPKKNWISYFRQGSLIITQPMIFMLFIAVFWRIKNFGLTENRILILLFGIWFLFLSWQFFYRQKLKIVFISLFTAIFLAAIFIFPFCKNHQLQRLKNTLISIHGSIQPLAQKIEPKLDFTLRKKLSGISEYLLNVHGVNSLKNILSSENLEKLHNEKKYNRSHFFMEKILQQKFVNHWQRFKEENDNKEKEKIILNRQQDRYKEILNVKNFDFSMKFSINSNGQQKKIENYYFYKNSQQKEYKLHLVYGWSLELYLKDKLITFFDLKEMIAKKDDHQRILSSEKMTLENDQAKIIFDYFSYTKILSTDKEDIYCYGQIFWKE